MQLYSYMRAGITCRSINCNYFGYNTCLLNADIYVTVLFGRGGQVKTWVMSMMLQGSFSGIRLTYKIMEFCHLKGNLRFDIPIIGQTCRKFCIFGCCMIILNYSQRHDRTDLTSLNSDILFSKKYVWTQVQHTCANEQTTSMDQHCCFVTIE